MTKIKKVGVLSMVKFQTALGALVGLIAGVLYSFGGLVLDILVTYGWIISNETPGLSYGTVLAFGALIGMPIIFAVFGLISGIVAAFSYNLIAKLVGGIEIELEQ